MGEFMDKRVIALLLVVAIILSVVATWKALTTQPKVTIIGQPQGAPISLTVTSQESKAPVQASSDTKDASVSLNVEENR